MRQLLLIGLLLLGLTSQCLASSPPDPLNIGKLLTENLLEREHMIYPERGLHYAEACTALGALWWAEAAGDKQRQARLIERYRVLLDNQNPLVNREPHVDQAVIGVIPLDIFRQTGEKAQLEQGLSFVKEQWQNPRPDGLTRQTRWWIDDMYMVGILQMQAWRATDNTLYRDRAADFVLAYLQKLQQTNGLFLHGPEAEIYWGRGNGWVAVALAEVLAGLPAEDPRQPQIHQAYTRMMQTLLRLQSDNGMWRQILDNPYAWAESSGSAMFAYAMALGLRQGFLKGDEYRAAVDKAWLALTAHLDASGNLREVGVGTGQSQDPHYYLDRDRVKGDFHGQAPMLWLVRERMMASERR